MPMNPRLLRPTQGGFSSPDADARAYLAAVRIADGSNLEPAVAKAISDFIIGCKADGIWSAIKASCILMGAKTLSGALTPLVGGSPTNVNNNFVSGDYNRKTGLVGNGTSKYLDSNRNNNADPQDSQHMAVYASAIAGSPLMGYMGAGSATASGTSMLQGRVSGVTGAFRTRSRNTSNQNGGTEAVGLMGMSRSGSGSYVIRANGGNTTASVTSQTPLSASVFVYGVNNSGLDFANDARLAFYSLGESLDLALLDTRVSALYTAIGAAI